MAVDHWWAIVTDSGASHTCTVLLLSARGSRGHCSKAPGTGIYCPGLYEFIAITQESGSHHSCRISS